MRNHPGLFLKKVTIKGESVIVHSDSLLSCIKGAIGDIFIYRITWNIRRTGLKMTVYRDENPFGRPFFPSAIL